MKNDTVTSPDTTVSAPQITQINITPAPSFITLPTITPLNDLTGHFITSSVIADQTEQDNAQLAIANLISEKRPLIEAELNKALAYYLRLDNFDIIEPKLYACTAMSEVRELTDQYNQNFGPINIPTFIKMILTVCTCGKIKTVQGKGNRKIKHGTHTCSKTYCNRCINSKKQLIKDAAPNIVGMALIPQSKINNLTNYLDISSGHIKTGFCVSFNDAPHSVVFIGPLKGFESEDYSPPKGIINAASFFTPCNYDEFSQSFMFGDNSHITLTDIVKIRSVIGKTKLSVTQTITKDSRILEAACNELQALINANIPSSDERINHLNNIQSKSKAALQKKKKAADDRKTSTTIKNVDRLIVESDYNDNPVRDAQLDKIWHETVSSYSQRYNNQLPTITGYTHESIAGHIKGYNNSMLATANRLGYEASTESGNMILTREDILKELDYNDTVQISIKDLTETLRQALVSLNITGLALKAKLMTTISSLIINTEDNGYIDYITLDQILNNTIEYARRL